MSDAKESAMEIEEKRRNVLAELIHTERKFVEQMEDVIQIYKNPLERAALSGQRILRIEKVKVIFSNVKEIVDLNRRFLEMLEQIDAKDVDRSIGKVMRPIAPFFRIYKNYCANYIERMAILRSYTSNKAHRFNAFVREASEKESRIAGLGLESLLIMPVQRIPKYSLLLKRLLKYTDPSCGDYKDLEACIQVIFDVAKDVDLEVSERENRIKVLEVRQTLVPQPEDLVRPHRRYVREGYLWKVCRKTNKRWYFYLFNDILIYGYKMGSSRVQHKRTIELHRVTSLSARQNNGCAFVVFGKPKSFVLVADDRRQKMEWLDDLTKCCEESAKLRQKRNGTTGDDDGGSGGDCDDAAPLWIPDSFSKSCMVCAVSKFNQFTNRRHHCRSCGFLVCDNCSRGKLLLAHIDPKGLSRVCDKCMARHAEREAERRLSSPRKKMREEDRDVAASKTENDRGDRENVDGGGSHAMYEDRVPLGSRPLPLPPRKNGDRKTSSKKKTKAAMPRPSLTPHRPPPLAPKSSKNDDVEGASDDVDKPSSPLGVRRSLSKSVLDAARKSYRKRLHASFGENDDSTSVVSTLRDLKSKIVENDDSATVAKSPSRQQRKKIDAMKYLAAKKKSTSQSRPIRRPPPVPGKITYGDDDAKRTDENVHRSTPTSAPNLAYRNSAQRKARALDKLKSKGVTRSVFGKASSTSRGKSGTLRRKNRKIRGSKIQSLMNKLERESKRD